MVVLHAITRAVDTPESRADLLEVEDEVRRTLKKFFSKTRGRRPLIVPHVFEM